MNFRRAFDGVAGNRVPQTIGRTCSGNDEQAPRVGLKPFCQRQRLVEIEFRDDPGDVWRQSLSRIVVAEIDVNTNGILGAMVSRYLRMKANGAAQCHHQVRRRKRVPVAEEFGGAPLAPENPTPRKVEKISIELDFLR